jgi:UDP-N-acetylglucosamine:LPS N-acetylglucosamine transferase
MIEESTLSADAVEKEIDALLGDPGRLSAMSQAARSLCVEDAATKVAEVVLTYGA